MYLYPSRIFSTFNLIDFPFIVINTYICPRYIEVFKSTQQEANMEARGRKGEDSDFSFGRGGGAPRRGAARGFGGPRPGPYDRPMPFARGGMGGGMDGYGDGMGGGIPPMGMGFGRVI